MAVLPQLLATFEATRSQLRTSEPEIQDCPLRAQLDRSTATAPSEDDPSVNHEVIQLTGLRFRANQGINPGTPNWVFADTARLEAEITTTPEGPEFRRKVKIQGAFFVQPSYWLYVPRARRVPRKTITAELGTTKLSLTLAIEQPAVLELRELVFAGNRAITKDDPGQAFPAPDWLLGRRGQNPVCYTGGVKPRVSVKLAVVTAPSRTDTITVTGTAALTDPTAPGPLTLTWTAQVTVAAGDTEVNLLNLASDNPLPQAVIADELTIAWSATADDRTPAPLGTTRHRLYVMLGASTGAIADHWTLVDLSCRYAQGATDARTLVARVFDGFKTRRLTRTADGVDLWYWKPQVQKSARSTAELLSLPDGSGECGAWASFLLDMYNVHGVNGGRKVKIASKHYHASGDRCQVGFTVKDAPGQRNDRPPKQFLAHFIVQDPITRQYYDPAYGTGPFADARSWKDSALESTQSVYKGQPAYMVTNYTAVAGDVLTFSTPVQVTVIEARTGHGRQGTVAAGTPWTVPPGCRITIPQRVMFTINTNLALVGEHAVIVFVDTATSGILDES